MQVLITGATRGIGRSLAQRYTAQGAKVIATARNLDGQDAGDGIEWHGLDVSTPASVTELAAALAGRPIDLLICNAGVALDKGQRLEDGYDAALWAQTFAVNVTGVFLTVQALLPNLKAAQGGKVAILSSQMASQSQAPGGTYIYRASKAAALNLGRNLAADLAASGLAVGIYHPGWVRTDMGGAGADIDVGTSVAGLMARFDVLSPATTGEFVDYTGKTLPF